VKTGRYSSGTLDKTIHHYFTDAWQCVEQRVDSSSDPERQHVWGLRYIDDLVLRDRDTTGNGTLDERLYAMADANWNVTGVVNTSGVVQERIEYTPVRAAAVFGGQLHSPQQQRLRLADQLHRPGVGVRRLALRLPPPLVHPAAGRVPVRRVDPKGTDWLDCMVACMNDALITNVIAVGVTGGAGIGGITQKKKTLFSNRRRSRRQLRRIESPRLHRSVIC
jgi:hypothetical protein